MSQTLAILETQVEKLKAVIGQYDNIVQTFKVKLDLWDRNTPIPEETADNLTRQMYGITANMDLLSSNVRLLRRTTVESDVALADELFRLIDGVRVGVTAVMKLIDELRVKP